MDRLKAAAAEFLAQRRIAVVGVARDGKNPANLIYRRLRDAGHEVFAVNPRATEVEGVQAFASVGGIPGGVDGVVIATPPAATEAVVAECAAAGVRRVWIHRSLGTGSVSPEAVALGQRLGMAVIDGACPMMFLDPVDAGHRCMRWLLGVMGKLPDGASYESPAPTPGS
jgi:uncharacterized protein